MVAFSFFWISLYWYGIFYFLAFLFWYVFLRYLKKYSFLQQYSPKVYWLLEKSPEDIILYTILGLLIWWRLGHILIYDFSYYYHNPLDVFFIWEGGMSFIGGLLGVVLSWIFLVRRYTFSYRDFFLLTDLLILPTWFWIMLWRIGNFLNQELYGRLVSDVFPTISSSMVSFFSSFGIFHIYNRVDQFLRINTNFLASFFEGFLVFFVSLILIVIFVKKKKWQIGILSSFFLVWYSLIRFLLEYFRMDSQSEYVFWFTKSQWFFVFSFVVGVFLMISFLRKKTSYIK